VPNRTPEELIRQIEELDQLLLDAVPGQDDDIADWMEERRRAIQALPRTALELVRIDEIQVRTNRLEEKFLHWRRSSIMELSLLEQHLRFLNEQQSGTANREPLHVDIRG
jgi:hypothetical protein